MRYCNSIFRDLLKPVSRRWFAAAVTRHEADAYDKSFRSWDHLVALIYAQLGGVQNLRGLEAAFEAHAHHRYHLGINPFARSTLSDANARRPAALFAETFAMLSKQAGRTVRREGNEMVRLIDSTPVPLGRIIDWARWNGRIRGLKLHVVYDPYGDIPREIAVTPSTINDLEEGRKAVLESGVTYVFDKAYCDYRWWTAIHEAGAVFVTRKKTNARFRSVRNRHPQETQGDGFTILDDHEVKLVSRTSAHKPGPKARPRLPMPMRRIRLRREKGGTLTLLTNDLERTAVEIAALYKARWQIELLFRWIKQHLNLRKFLGHNENAIRLQIIAAMIAFLLLRIAARDNGITMPAIRFAELVCLCLFQRKPLARIERPPDVNPSRAQPKSNSNQMEFCYA